MVILTHSKSSTASLANIAWKTLEKVAAKEQNRDELEDGSEHIVNLDVLGTVDGKPVFQRIESTLMIGYSQTRSSSINPKVLELLAYILGKLNVATRERIFQDIPDAFIANDQQIPEVDQAIVDQTEAMLKSLRRSVPVNASGPVHCRYDILCRDEMDAEIQDF
ncbi:hypothetical protein OAG71_01630 [bacterium]|nr:hypothetical protein [bacterium]